MQKSSKYITLRPIILIIMMGFVLSSIVMELLPEEEAKVFVIPTMVAALFAGATQLAVFKNR